MYVRMHGCTYVYLSVCLYVFRRTTLNKAEFEAPNGKPQTL